MFKFAYIKLDKNNDIYVLNRYNSFKEIIDNENITRSKIHYLISQKKKLCGGRYEKKNNEYIFSYKNTTTFKYVNLSKEEIQNIIQKKLYYEKNYDYSDLPIDYFENYYF